MNLLVLFQGLGERKSRANATDWIDGRTSSERRKKKKKEERKEIILLREGSTEGRGGRAGDHPLYRHFRVVGVVGPVVGPSERS
jgi:hypothetical protein